MRFAGANTAIQSLFGDMGGPSFGDMEDAGIQGQSMQKQNKMYAEADAIGAAANAAATAKAGEYQAEAMRAQGAAAGQSAIAGGIGSLASGIAGGFGSMMGGGGGVTPSSYAFGNSYGGVNSGVSFQQSQPSLYGFRSLG